MEYDVFISCKSEDYIYAEQVYNYLKQKGFLVFLSSKELERMKDSEYMDAISDALDSAYHLIVFSTSKENVVSKWVKFEWSTFLNEILSGRKEGQILTILRKMSVPDLPIQLRRYESFTNEDYVDKILSYVETPSYIRRKQEEEEKARLEEEKRKREKEAEQRKERIIKEIDEESADYRIHSATLESRSLQIIEKQKLIARTNKVCPVCKTSLAIESKYCVKCGWTFSPFFDAFPKGDKDHIFLMQSIWKSVHDSDLAKRRLNETVSSLEMKIKEKDSTVSTLEDELKKCNNRIVELKKELLDSQDETQIARVTQKNIEKELQAKIKEISQELNNANKALNESLQKISLLEKDLLDSKSEQTKLHDKLLEQVEIVQQYRTNQNTKKTDSSRKQTLGTLVAQKDIKEEHINAHNTIYDNRQVIPKCNGLLYFMKKDEIYDLIMEYCNKKTNNKGTKLKDLKFDFKSFIRDIKECYGIILQQFAIINLSVSGLIEVIWRNRNKNNLSQNRP